jgi:glycosyltransferase involved in cell wall biosynthesis
VTVHLEHIWPEAMGRAQCDIVIPNPEWFDRFDRSLLGRVTVWAKTVAAQRAFAELVTPVKLLGFTSIDRRLEDVDRETSCLHLAGRSSMKGTEQLVKLWMKNAHWPTLTVVHDSPRLSHLPSAENVFIKRGRCSDRELQELQNRCRIHICTSETEGWGHYLVEAASVGAEVITLDAAPMSELIDNDRGYLVKAVPYRRQHLAVCHRFDEVSFAAALDRALAALVAEKSNGAAARRWYEENDLNFQDRVAEQVRDLQVQLRYAPN